MTNADRIRNMNDEELAKFLNQTFCDEIYVEMHEEYPNSVFNTKQDTLKWLESETW